MSQLDEFRHGDRIKVTASSNGALPIGATATVKTWNPQIRQLEVAWDEGRNLRTLLLLDAKHESVALVAADRPRPQESP